MSTHNICFCGEIRKIFTGYPPLSRPMLEAGGTEICNKIPAFRLRVKNLATFFKGCGIFFLKPAYLSSGNCCLTLCIAKTLTPVSFILFPEKKVCWKQILDEGGFDFSCKLVPQQ